MGPESITATGSMDSGPAPSAHPGMTTHVTLQPTMIGHIKMPTTPSLTGRTALVTGGSRGIGAAIALTLAEAGARVAINYRKEAGQADAVAEKITAAGGEAAVFAADVSLAEDVNGLVQRVAAVFGPIDILINNAGIAITRGLDDLTEADFDQTMLVNLKSA